MIFIAEFFFFEDFSKLLCYSKTYSIFHVFIELTFKLNIPNLDQCINETCMPYR